MSVMSGRHALVEQLALAAATAALLRGTVASANKSGSSS
jgi:hypothetical protein